MRQALSFLTIFGGARSPDRRALPWFPIVGALIGAVVGAVWWAASQHWPLPVAAALAVGADLGLTGLLHIDGLADSADGLLPPLPRQRRLEVMHDPSAGAFAVAVVGVVLLLRFAVLSSTVPAARNIVIIAAIWSVSRAAMAVTLITVRSARPHGLAGAFGGGDVLAVLAIGAPLSIALAAFGTEPFMRGVLAAVACAIGAASVVAFARHRIGGFTGDVLGAAGVIGETVALVVLAVR
jgi:adenosylcobinamide-GDP ribazoletransferase